MKAPWWFTLLLVAAAVPMVIFSGAAMKSLSDASESGLYAPGWLFPAYIVLSGVCAWVCWERRRTLSWILLALMIITDIMTAML